MRAYSILALGLVALPRPIWPQNITGSITGSVQDPSGGNVPNAAVTATDTATGEKHDTATTPAGVYVLPLLPLGSYELAVESPGFKRYVRSNLRLGADQRLRVDVQLELGALSEQVRVTAEPPAIKTDEATVGSSFTPLQIENLPVGREVFNAMRVLPGVQPGPRGIASGNINGSRANATDYEMDGLSAVSSNLTDVTLQPITEMVEELAVQTAQYSADQGRGSAQVSLTTRPGTNEFHGTLFHFFQNNALNANSFMSNAVGTQKPTQRYNLFGGSLGGPVLLPRYNGRNRTFFNVGYEGIRERGFGEQVSSVPSAAMRSGDFRGMNAIFDPASTRPGPDGRGFVRTPFANNQIAASQIHPVASNLLAVSYPLPNRPGAANNYVRQGATPTDSDAVNVRGDHNFSDRSRLSMRYILRQTLATSLLRYDGPAAAGDGSLSLLQDNSTQAGSVDHTYVFTPALINNFRFGIYRMRQVFSGPGTFEDWSAKVGLQNVPGDKFPLVTIVGLSGFGGANVFDGFPGRNWNLGNSLTWVRGRHSIKTGFEYRHFVFADARGTASTFAFDNRATMDPQTSRLGEAFASFLTGYPSTASLNLVRREGFNLITDYYAGYVHDDFKLNRNLTLNIGLRWETTTPRKEANNFQSVFDLASQTLKIAGRDGYPRTLHDTDWNNFQPRFGFAWLPFDGQKTVIRGGYGLFFLPADVTGNSLVLGPWQKNTSWVTPDNGITFPVTFSSAFPRVTLDPSAPAEVTPTTNVNWVPRDSPSPYTQQWSFNVERELSSGMVAEIGYVGTRGLHLDMGINLNQVPPHLLGPGNAQSRRPYPLVGNITTIRTSPTGASTYHSMQLRIERRLARGFGVQIGYTLSKSIDNTSGTNAFRDFGFSAVQNNYDLRAERSVSGFDATHVLGYNFIWQLPYGKDRRYSSGGWLDYVIGGWNLSALSTIRSGRPLTMGVAPNQTGSLGGGIRPNRIRDTPLPDEERNRLRWCDASGFVAPPQFTFGNSSRTEPRLREPGALDLDFLLAKEVRFSESKRLQLRSEFFNALNHYNPGTPNTVIGNAAVTQITTGNPGRTIQLSLRLYY